MSDDFMLTAEELRLKRRRRRRIFALAVMLVLAVVALFFGGRPMLNAIKAWQARRHAIFWRRRRFLPRRC